MKYNLPKPYLSYSQIQLWLKNKSQYRERYYLGKPSFETPESIYGKRIAKLLEDPEEIKKHPTLKNVPRYQKSEYAISIEVDGIPIMGYLDSFDPETNSFYEYKTSHTKNWNTVSVAKHMQLPFYSFLIEQLHGKVNRECHLIWIETQFMDKSIMFEGIKLTAKGRELELTGKIESFKRIIPKWEREHIKKEIIKVAEEISLDYTNYEKSK